MDCPRTTFVERDTSVPDFDASIHSHFIILDFQMSNVFDNPDLAGVHFTPGVRSEIVDGSGVLSHDQLPDNPNSSFRGLVIGNLSQCQGGIAIEVIPTNGPEFVFSSTCTQLGLFQYRVGFRARPNGDVGYSLQRWDPFFQKWNQIALKEINVPFTGDNPFDYDDAVIGSAGLYDSNSSNEQFDVQFNNLSHFWGN